MHAIPPLGPNGESIHDIIARIKNRPNGTLLSYTLKITEPQWAAQVSLNPVVLGSFACKNILNQSTSFDFFCVCLQVATNTTGQFILNLKNSNTKYCGHVFYRPIAKWGRSPSEKASFCIELPGELSTEALFISKILHHH